MQLADLLRETLDEDNQDVWENERTPTPVRRFGVRLHAAGLSIRETVAILDLLGVDRSHGAVWNWVHTLSEAQSDPPTASPSRVAVDEKQIEVDGEKKWLYAAVDTESKLLLEIDVDHPKHDYLAPHGGRRGMGEVLVRAFGYTVAAGTV